MTYENAMNCIGEIQKKGSILGLGPVKELLSRLGNPQDQEKIIHVAGTNGKGSICTFLEQLYRAEGKLVGRYISPTIHCYLERFQINGEYMGEEVFAKLFSQVYSVYCDMQKEGLELPTAFEIETAIAFLYFKQADIVILETGMGGREDATNVVKKPLCTVFASIGMDHMQFLGNTIEEIAYQKAGIMKKGCCSVCYPNCDMVNSVLKNEFDTINAVDIKDRHNTVDIKSEHNTDIFFVDKNDIRIVKETLTGSTFIYEGEEYSISLAGRYQVYNAATAIKVKMVLDHTLKKESLLNAKWEGRFDLIGDDPIFIKDGAHNVDGVAALRESIEKHFTNYHLIFIIGVLKDKEYKKMMEMICPLAKKIYTITPPVERGLSGEVLAGVVQPYCSDVTYCHSIKEAVTKAIDAAKKDDTKCGIIAWGSLSYIGEL